MTTANIYLTFEGNCEEAFSFYRNVLGGEFVNVGRFSDMPASPEYPIKDTDKNKIMHISLPISRETVIMGSDTATGFGPPIVQGNNFSISINPETKEEGDKIFEGLSKDGKVGMPMAETFWGSYFGYLTDKFGVNWMVNVDLNKKPTGTHHG